MNSSRRFLASGLVSILISGLTSFIPPSASAVENGTDATGSSFVVKIKTSYSPTLVSFCSGALIAPSIIATAGHCVLDSLGLVSKEIYVGEAGRVNPNNYRTWDKVTSVQITPSFKNDIHVNPDDIVFLLLPTPRQIPIPVRLASETEMTSLRSSSVPLKIFGYGTTNNLNSNESQNPYSFDANFSTLSGPNVNDGIAVSRKGRNCVGDSGGPVLSISATEVIILGVITGGHINADTFCSRLETDGTYYTAFTLINRYSNLAFASATTQMTSDSEKLISMRQELNDATDWNEELQTKVGTLEGEKEDLQTQLDDLATEIENLNLQIEALEARLPSTITCIKGKLTKKVAAVKPVCPVGYKKK